MKLEDYNFSLPKVLIAKRPGKEKKNSNLLICNTKKIVDFKNITNYLNQDDVLVFNDTKVIPSIIIGRFKDKDVKITLLEKKNNFIWYAFVKYSKKIKIGDNIIFKDKLSCQIIDKEGTIAKVKFNQINKKVLSFLYKYGNLPLPPYTKNLPNRKLDEKYYQTIFAKNNGAVACPTAGLHFNKKIIKKLKEQNITLVNTTLHVGMGTFLPLTREKIKENTLHKEKGIISKSSANLINKSIKEGKKIVAVGTTVIRLLEACYAKYGKIQYFNEETDIFIYPGFKFNVIDKLLTNFHLPKSSLLLLVSAFGGKKKIINSYNFAIENKMNFFSFGDAMLIDKDEI